MTPILASKAKEILESFCEFSLNSKSPSAKQDRENWLKSPEAAALLSGEDWKEDGWIVKESVQAYWLQAMKELEKKDLGDIERKNWEKVRDETMKVLKSINND